MHNDWFVLNVSASAFPFSSLMKYSCIQSDQYLHPREAGFGKRWQISWSWNLNARLNAARSRVRKNSGAEML